MTPYWTSHDGRHVIYCGDAMTVLRELPDCSVQCCVTSPPYWAPRDYGHPDQMGAEDSPEAYVAALVGVLREEAYCEMAVRRLERELRQPYLPGLEPQKAEQGMMFEKGPQVAAAIVRANLGELAKAEKERA